MGGEAEELAGGAGGRGAWVGGHCRGGLGGLEGGGVVMRGRLGEGGWRTRRSWWAIDYKGDA